VVAPATRRYDRDRARRCSNDYDRRVVASPPGRTNPREALAAEARIERAVGVTRCKRQARRVGVRRRDDDRVVVLAKRPDLPVHPGREADDWAGSPAVLSEPRDETCGRRCGSRAGRPHAWSLSRPDQREAVVVGVDVSDEGAEAEPLPKTTEWTQLLPERAGRPDGVSLTSASPQQPVLPNAMFAKTSPLGSTASPVTPASAPSGGNIARPSVPNPRSRWPRADRAATHIGPRLSPATTIRPDGARRIAVTAPWNGSTAQPPFPNVGSTRPSRVTAPTIQRPPYAPAMSAPPLLGVTALTQSASGRVSKSVCAGGRDEGVTVALPALPNSRTGTQEAETA
jgi:hypothetical protein